MASSVTLKRSIHHVSTVAAANDRDESASQEARAQFRERTNTFLTYLHTWSALIVGAGIVGPVFLSYLIAVTRLKMGPGIIVKWASGEEFSAVSLYGNSCYI
jgi:hypothetical protein